MGELCLERPSLAECVAQAMDYVRGVFAGHEGEKVTDQTRADALRIVEEQIWHYGHRPDEPFGLCRKRMAVPPKRRNVYRPRKGALDSKDQLRKRSDHNVRDLYAEDDDVRRLRIRLGNQTESRVQNAQKLIEDTEVFEVRRPGRVPGRRENLSNAWMFGKEIATRLSKALKGRKSEESRYLNRAKALSDFVLRGLGESAQAYMLALLEHEAQRNAERAKQARENMRKAQEAVKALARKNPFAKPARRPEPSPGQQALDPEVYSREATERAVEEERLERLKASGGALKGMTLSTLVSRAGPG